MPTNSRCPHCGGEIGPNGVCKRCGYKAGAPAKKAPPKKASPPPKKK